MERGIILSSNRLILLLRILKQVACSFIKSTKKQRWLQNVPDEIQIGSDPTLFKPIINSLLYQDHADEYMLLADYEPYILAQEQVNKIFQKKKTWTRMSILNVANMGKFSSDRTIAQYAKNIWKVKSIPIKIPKKT